MTSMTNQLLPVAAIENGSVIDHITIGNALKIVKLLKLASHHKQVTLGLNLPSQRLGYKDIIKVEDRKISKTEASQIAILAPQATITLIHNFEIANKFKVELPSKIEKIIDCPNIQCISNHEAIASTSHVIQKVKNQIELECYYCKKLFTH